MVSWQAELERHLVGRLPRGATWHLTGSALHPDQLDGWSDLDLHIDLAGPDDGPDGPDDGSDDGTDPFADLPVWAVTESDDLGRQVLRIVLADGRRVDLVVQGGRLPVPPSAADNEIRMVAALAVAKLGRGDHLIGMHLTLDLMRSCLVQAMLVRDRSLGTTVHRFGSDQDAMADEVISLLSGPMAASPRPNVVERAVELYGRWRSLIDPDYRPDWSGLRALIDRGLDR